MTAFSTFTIDSPTDPALNGEWYRKDEVDAKLVELGYEIEARNRRVEGLRHLLERLLGWDMMDVTADGPYWKRTIREALNIPDIQGDTVCENCGVSLTAFDHKIETLGRCLLT